MSWSGTNFLEKSNYIKYYSNHPVNYVLRVAFLVSQKMKSTVIDFDNINERLRTPRLRGKFQNNRPINLHAPAEENDIFYETVKWILEACLTWKF